MVAAAKEGYRFAGDRFRASHGSAGYFPESCRLELSLLSGSHKQQMAGFQTCRFEDPAGFMQIPV